MGDITKVRAWSDEREDGRGPDDWPPPDEHVESLITGELRTRILGLVGQADVGQQVTLVETTIEDGYSEYTVEMNYEIEVLVGGLQVWFHDSGWYEEAGMAAFLAWAAPKDA